jgi:hypothetical protein
LVGGNAQDPMTVEGTYLGRHTGELYVSYEYAT